MELEVQRKKIDEIDEKIVSLVAERVQLAKAIGGAKKVSGQKPFVPGREELLLDSLAGRHPSIPRQALAGIFNEVISACRAVQQPLRIAFLGPETSFTHQAAVKKFGSMPEFNALHSVPAVFLAVEKGQADYGIVPIENSAEGTVNSTLNMFLKSQVGIVAEIGVNVSHCLASKYSLATVKKVFSHPQAIAQCANWLAKHLPKAELVEVASTSEAAEKATVYHSSAAITSAFAAQRFDLSILAENIGDEADNRTRFLVLGKTEPVKTGKDKTGILFSVKHKPGALVVALEALQRHQLNMTTIWSRPTLVKKGEYEFFVEFQGFVEDKPVQQALSELEQHCGFVKVLGSFPEGV